MYPDTKQVTRKQKQVGLVPAFFFVVSGMLLYAAGQVFWLEAMPKEGTMFYIGFLVSFGLGWSWRKY